VAITGIGVVCPAGNHPGSFWPGLLSGEGFTRLIDRFDASEFPCRVAGQVAFDPSELLPDPRQMLVLDRTSQLSIAAARLACRDAALDDGALADAAVVVGSGFGCIETVEAAIIRHHEKRPTSARAWVIPRAMANAPAAAVSMALRAHGPHHVVAAACASGTIAIGTAARMVAAGDTDISVAGGADAPLVPSVMAAWCAMRVLTERNDEPSSASRPFSVDRDGMVLAEGAAMVVLEEVAHALRRGAPIYAEIAGFGESSDACHLTAPSAAGQVRAIRRALASAGLEASAVDHVNAHGTATPANDRVETQALKEALGQHVRSVPISATKSMIGHAMGAAGAIEVAATACAVRHQTVHPTAHITGGDVDCDLDYVAEGKRTLPIQVAMKQSFAFGGANAVLILRRLDDAGAIERS
jgi:3-oxoacyl-[acyl-carrier-protein] synthase II